MRYISTGQRTSASVLWRNMFLPQWAYLPYEYPALEQEFAFEKDGEPSRATLENTVKNFFRNFSVDWSERDEDGTYTFSDSETVVKYYPDVRILEYYSYENYAGNDRTGLLEGYQICCNFLKMMIPCKRIFIWRISSVPSIMRLCIILIMQWITCR